MERPEPPETIAKGDAALEQGDPATAQAHYLRWIALCLTDIAAALVEIHQDQHHSAAAA